MALTLIDNHVESALARLLQRLKESYNMNSLLTTFINPIQDIENESYALYTERSIYTAVGAQLDGTGRIVGLDRDDLDDIDYRSALFIQIQINKAGGEPESIITAIRQLFKTELIVFKEIYPANYEVYITSNLVVENAKALITSISPAGVGNITLLQGTDTPFCLDEINLINIDYEVNEDEDNLIVDSNDNSILEVITQGVVQTCDGFGFAEVFILENGDPLLSENGGIMAEVLN